jgi:hypothetical protein
VIRQKISNQARSMMELAEIDGARKAVAVGESTPRYQGVTRRGRTEAHSRFRLAGNEIVPRKRRVLLGDALAELGRTLSLSDHDVDVLESIRDRAPAEPLAL